MRNIRHKFVLIATGLLIGILFSLYLINSHLTAQSQPVLAPGAGANAFVTSSEMEEAEKEELRIQIANTPAYFIKNKGQIAPDADSPSFGRTAKEVKYYFKGNDNVYFTDEGVVFQKTVRNSETVEATRPVAHTDTQPATSKSLAYKLDFVGARPTSPEARKKLKGKVAYFKGNDRSKWHNDIPTYQEIVYPGLYASHPEDSNSTDVKSVVYQEKLLEVDNEVYLVDSGNIDLVYKGVPGGMKYEFIVQPGADPDVIRLAYTGIEELSMDDTGNLIIHTALGDVKDAKPYCYQEIDGREVEVGCNFRIHKTVGAIHKLPLQDATGWHGQTSLPSNEVKGLSVLSGGKTTTPHSPPLQGGDKGEVSVQKCSLTSGLSTLNSQLSTLNS